MSNLTWQTQRSLENSLAEFIQSKIDEESLTILDQNGNSRSVSVRVGYEFNTDWNLPVIQLYCDSKLAPRLSIGSNKRQKSYLIVIDIRATNKGSQLDLTDWTEETINDGFIFYQYYKNPSQPTETNKVKMGYVSIDFVSNLPLNLGDGADLYDKYRQNITISATIAQ